MQECLLVNTWSIAIWHSCILLPKVEGCEWREYGVDESLSII